MNAFEAVFLVLLILALVVLGPIFTIWALNALFGFGIAPTFGNWLAMAWIHIVFGSAAASSS